MTPDVRREFGNQSVTEEAQMTFIQCLATNSVDRSIYSGDSALKRQERV